MAKLTFEEFKEQYISQASPENMDDINSAYIVNLTLADLSELVDNIINEEYKEYLASTTT